MKTLLILFSIFLSFFLPSASASNSSAARSLYRKVRAIQMASQKYYDQNTFSHAGISIGSLCTAHNIGGVCGANNDGITRAVTYAVTQGPMINQAVITAARVPSAVGNLVKRFFLQNHLCTPEYQAGVLTLTCKTPLTDNTSNERACLTNIQNAGSDSSTCTSALGSKACKILGVTTGNIATLSTKSSWLQTCSTALAPSALTLCQLSILAAGSNATQCISALAGSNCVSSGIYYSPLEGMQMLDTYAWLQTCADAIAGTCAGGPRTAWGSIFPCNWGCPNSNYGNQDPAHCCGCSTQSCYTSWLDC